MSDVAISVEDLGKKYGLGAKAQPYKTLRESLIDVAGAPARAFGQLTGRVSHRQEKRPEFWALRDVTFDVKRGEVLGIIGRNGAGKSTLLKLLSQVTDPTEGRIRVSGRVASLLEVGTGFHPELSGRENVFLNGAILGMTRREIVGKFDEIVAFAEVEKFIDTVVKHYSSGMYLRLAFAVAAHLEPDILVIDEVLAVGDIDFQRKCLGRMDSIATEGRTVLFVSHNLAAVRKMCPQAILLREGRLVAAGNANNVIETYEQSELSEQSADDLGCIYRCPERLRDLPYIIDRVELISEEGQVVTSVRTWDAVRFRFWYRASTAMRGGSVVLAVGTREGVSVLLCSTSPDSDVAVNFKFGEHYVDCMFYRFPLSAGTYMMGVGLAQPNAAWLFRDDALPLTVHPRDVYGSGLAPKLERAIIAPECEWIEG